MRWRSFHSHNLMPMAEILHCCVVLQVGMSLTPFVVKGCLAIWRQRQPGVLGCSHDGQGSCGSGRARSFLDLVTVEYWWGQGVQFDLASCYPWRWTRDLNRMINTVLWTSREPVHVTWITVMVTLSQWPKCFCVPPYNFVGGIFVWSYCLFWSPLN